MGLKRYFFRYEQYRKRMGPRVFGYFLLALATAYVARYLGHYVPDGVVEAIGDLDVMPILQSITATMLTISTFALSTTVGANSSAVASTTPRAFRLILQDQGSQDMLVRFMGAFVFSVATLLMVPLGIYYQGGRIILIIVTLYVLVSIVISFIRWAMNVRELGSLSSSISKIEKASLKAFQTYWSNPASGCNLFTDDDRLGVSEMKPYYAYFGKYLHLIDEDLLEEIAKGFDVEIYLNAIEGDFLTRAQPLLWVKSDEEISHELKQRLRDGFEVGDARDVSVDGRYGILMLQETACKALSSAVNDAGTAKECIHSAYRILHQWQPLADKSCIHPHIWKRPIALENMLNEFYITITHDAGDAIGVHLQSINSLVALSHSENKELSEVAKKVAHNVYELATELLHRANEVELLRTAFRRDVQ